MLLKILMFRFGPDPGLLNSAFRLLNTDLFGISTKQYAFFCYCENVKYAVVLFFTCNVSRLSNVLRPSFCDPGKKDVILKKIDLDNLNVNTRPVKASFKICTFF